MAKTGVMARARPERRWPALGVVEVRVLTVVAAVLLWEGLARSGLFYKDVVPETFAILSAAAAELADASFYADLGVSFLEVAVGFVVGSAVGILCGIALGANPFLRRVCDPYLNALGSTPKIIFLPIIFLLFGVGIESKMAQGALSGFFPTVFATILGMVLIDRVLIRVGRSFNLTARQMVTKIYLPAMVGPVVVGLRLGMAVAIIGVLVAEIKFANSGLGFRMMGYYDQFKIPSMYATMLILFALAALANWGMSRLQARFDHRGAGRRGAATSVEIAR